MHKALTNARVFTRFSKTLKNLMLSCAMLCILTSVSHSADILLDCRGLSNHRYSVWGSGSGGKTYVDDEQRSPKNILVRITDTKCSADWGYSSPTTLNRVSSDDNSISCLSVWDPPEFGKKSYEGITWVRFERSLFFTVSRITGEASWIYKTDQEQATGGHEKTKSTYKFSCSPARKLF